MSWLKRLLKRDAPHLKMEVGQEVYINGVKHIIVGMNWDARGHVDIQTELALQYKKSRMIGHSEAELQERKLGVYR